MNTRQTARGKTEVEIRMLALAELDMERDRERESAIIRNRYATRGAPGPRIHKGTPYQGEATRQQ